MEQTVLLGARPDSRNVLRVLAGHEDLRVHLQPIVELSTGEVWAVEALARFQGHPAPGPAAWFAAALRDGEGPALEELALRRALDHLPWLPQGMRLTVNLSARALLLPTVRELLLGCAQPGVLVELTEHELVEDYAALLSALAGLRTAGLGLCIDDFGAGSSSLQHVLHLAPDVVKLDLTLVQGVAGCERRQALVEAMLAFCSSTGALLVAEGVEHGDDLLALVRLGVGHAQGSFLARPAPLDVVLPVLTSLHRPAVLVLP